MTMFGNAIGLSPGNLGMKLFKPSAAGFVPVDVPQAEADCLIALYNLTAGAGWTNNTNWLVDTTVGNWFGVTVAGGHVTWVQLNANNLVGSLATWSPDCLPSLIYLYLNNNAGLIGDISGWVLPNSLVYLRLYNTGVSGDISGWVLPNSLMHLYLYSTNLSGTPDISGNTAMSRYYYHNCALTQANVDAVLLSVYNRRMAFTFATPILLIHGTNAAPSGVYGAMCPPTTGKEYAFELVNDSCGDGFITWTVTFTP